MTWKSIIEMTPDEFSVEILAQALWLQIYGETTLRDSWLTWALANADGAEKYRIKAREMLSAVPSGSHHGLGWMLH